MTTIEQVRAAGWRVEELEDGRWTMGDEHVYTEQEVIGYYEELSALADEHGVGNGELTYDTMAQLADAQLAV